MTTGAGRPFTPCGQDCTGFDGRDFGNSNPAEPATTPSLPDAAFRSGCDVAFPRAGFPSALVQPHLDLVHLAVAPGRRKCQQILGVELVGDRRKGGPEILSEPDFEVAAAGLFGDAGKPGVRQVGE